MQDKRRNKLRVFKHILNIATNAGSTIKPDFTRKFCLFKISLQKYSGYKSVNFLETCKYVNLFKNVSIQDYYLLSLLKLL